MISTDGDCNFRRVFAQIFAEAKTKETALLAEFSMIEARLGTALETEADQPRIVEIVHRLRNLGCATHPEIKAIAEGGPLPETPE